MIRLQLTEPERAAVQALRRDRGLAPEERDRVEMVLRGDGAGPAGLHRGRPGPPKNEARRQEVTAALDRRLEQDRTWTAAQLAAALEEEGIALSTRQTRKYLGWMGARWRRTARSLTHKQDAERVAAAAQELVTLKKRPGVVTSNSSTLTSAASAPASPRR